VARDSSAMIMHQSVHKLTGIIGLISAWRPARGTRPFGIVWKDANTLKPPVTTSVLHRK